MTQNARPISPMTATNEPAPNQYANAVIRLHFYDPSIVTVEEFDAIVAELNARRMAGDLQIGDRILIRLLSQHTWRRDEIVRGLSEGKDLEQINRGSG